MADETPIPAPPSGTTVQAQPNQSQPSGGQIPPPPSGDIVMAQPPESQPSTESGQPDQSQFADFADYTKNVGIGAAKGLESTTEGIGSLLHKIPGIGDKLIPQEGLTAENKQATPVGSDQMVGYGGENLMERIMGDEALKGLSMADKMAQSAKVAKILEGAPKLMEYLKLGASAGKAIGELSPEEATAVRKSPLLTRAIGVLMDSARLGPAQPGQTVAKTGGDVKEAGKQGLETFGASAVLGAAFGALGRATEKAGEAGKAVQEASELGKNAPTSSELGQKVSDQINDAETKMHGDFEAGIQKLKGDLGDQKIPYAGSPLQKAAQEALQGKTEAKGVLGGAFQGLAGGSDESKKFLNSLNDPKIAGDMVIDELIQYRQQLGEKIGTLTKGGTSSADRADVQVYQKLRDEIDDTIQGLAKQSGKPEAAQDYDALRAAYKDKVKLFQSPAMQAMSAPGVASDTKLDNAAKYLLSGGNKLDKINTLSETIGEPAVKDLGKGIIQKQLADASTDGQINPAKFVKNFKQIDNLPPEVKEKLFDTAGAQAGLDKLSSDLKSAANYQKLVRAGVLSAASGAGGAAGAAIHPAAGLGALGIALGLAGENGAALLDKVANSPKLWSAFRTAGKIGATLEESPAARRVGTAAKYGAGNALGNVLGGATEPLSQPEDQSVVYTNQ